MNRRLAAITGASSGIGEVFARKLAAQGFDLLLIARRRDRLDSLGAELAQKHQIAYESLVADLSTDIGMSAVAKRLMSEPRLWLLVNNAGFGVKGHFESVPVEEHERMHRVHIDATLRLTHAALPGMVARDEGGIISVSSVAGFLRSPGSVTYCGTKAWINSFMEGIYLELKSKGSKVAAQALCPGFTYSEFHDTLGVSRDPIPKSLWLTAEHVVDDSLAALRTGKLFVVPGWRYKLVVALMTRFPVSWRLALSARAPHRKGRE
jgi:short-subunit dehydrogenase